MARWGGGAERGCLRNLASQVSCILSPKALAPYPGGSRGSYPLLRYFFFFWHQVLVADFPCGSSLWSSVRLPPALAEEIPN